LSDSEHYDALPVLAEVSEVRPVEQDAPRSLVERVAALPAPALAAAGGFLAGVTTFVLFRAFQAIRHPRRSLRVGRGRGRKVEVADSRSFLVDIHLLKR
jgi:hypothetical protein